MSLLADLRERVRARAASRGVGCCTACDTPGPHTDEQCKARRPLCHTGCGRRTCIQARANGHPPTCLDCYFARPPRKAGDVGQCEVHDLVPTDDDAVDVRCPRTGRCILEDMGSGRKRLRFVCSAHGLDSAYEVN